MAGNLYEDLQGRFLPSFDSFGKVVSEINQSETRMACGGHVC
jgi:hypothetical protein